MPLIAIEGGSRVGKATQHGLLRERLPLRFPDHTFLFTQEPGGSPYAELIRELILRIEAEEADAQTLFHLSAAARANHVLHVIRPALERGEVVITNGFFGRTFAHQLRAMGGHTLDRLFDLHVATIGLAPDLTIILDMDQSVAMSRIADRAGNNHFDARDRPFHERLRAGYAEYAARLRSQEQDVQIIEANRSVELVFGHIMWHISAKLNSR